MPKIQDKTRRRLVWALKFLLTLAGLVIVVWSIQSSNTEFNLISEQWQNNSKTLILALVILGIGSILNWFGEVKKWQGLVDSISFKEAVKQSLVGHSLALFTPNKWGEYGGKCLFYTKKQTSKIIALVGLGHLSQLTMTLLFGCFGLLSVYRTIEIMEIIQFKWPWVVLLSILLIGLVLSFKIVRKKLWNIWLNFRKIKAEKIKSTLLWSGFRYVVFSHQFLFLMWCLGADVSYVLGLSLISTVYLLSSMLPIFAIGDAFVKGSVAVVLMSLFGLPVSVVLLTVFLMWIGNVLLPASLGYFWLWSWQPHFLNSKS